MEDLTIRNCLVPQAPLGEPVFSSNSRPDSSGTGLPSRFRLHSGLGADPGRFSGTSMVPEDPDLPLVESLQAGNDQALNTLMDRHQENLFRFIYRQIPNEADALDLTIETFVRAYFNIEKFRPAAKFRTWLYRIALNLCRDHVRSRAYRYAMRTDPFDFSAEESGSTVLLWLTEDTPDQKTERQEELVALENAINALPPDLKSAFVLRALENRPEAEAAELLGLSTKGVGTRVYRARKLLMAKMSAMGF